MPAVKFYIHRNVFLTHCFRRAMAWLLLVAFFVTFLPIEAGMNSGTLTVYADPLPPSIDEVTIEKVDQVVGETKETSYRVIFNGYRVNDIESIRIHNIVSGTSRTVSTADFIRIDNANMAAVNFGTLVSFFGLNPGQDQVRFTLIYESGQFVEQMTVFQIPTTNLPDIERIFDSEDWIFPAGWPATIRNETGKELRFRGSNLNSLDPLQDQLYLIRDTESAVPFTINASNEVVVAMGGSGIPTGNNMTIRFEKPRGNIRVHYIVKSSLNIIRPLELGTVRIEPMSGTRGTLLRIQAGVGSTNEDHWRDLIAAGTRVYVGGVEAVRNIIEEEGQNGTFTYIEDGQQKVGLEVIVPTLDTPGPKQILIVNAANATYVHPDQFEYFEAETPRLRVLNLRPDRGPIETNNLIELITINNLITLDNLDINDATQVEMEEIDASELTYQPFIDEAAGSANQQLRFIGYTLADGTRIEKRISITVGLPATIESLEVAPYTGTLNELAKQTDMSVRTARVATVGPMPVRVRTETVHLDADGNVINFIAEQAPVGPDDMVNYTFYRDDDAPVITAIVPSQGPFDKNIIATIEGSQFTVRYREGQQYLPTIIIGKPGRYKVINQHGMFRSTTATGAYNEANRITPLDGEAFQPLQVLDAAGNVVDGQIRQRGTRIKLTIPRGLVDEDNPYYEGPADIIVRNPTAEGTLGAEGSLANGFIYLPKPTTDITITSVTPQRVAVGSNEQVVVRGTNFQSGMQITIDGEIVPNPQINAAAGTIILNAPDGRPGETWLQVLNPETGAHASHPFEYVRSDSLPTITSITPAIGGKGTLVIIKGTNFFPPRADGETEAARKGTVVQFAGKDVNKTYHTDENDPDEWQLVPFTDPFTGEAIQNAVGEDIMTYGSHVAVVDNETIYLIVPDPQDPTHSFIMNTPLDVTVLNPDLGKATRTGGFTILNILDSQRPIITDIIPDLGDYRGGNIVEITGSRFSDGAKVYFGNQEATVFRRSSTGNWIRVYVPAYSGTLMSNPNDPDDNQQNFAFVPVTVQNNDNSSTTVYNGYQYVNPGYTPVIERIVENTGNTAGGDRVLIHGRDFRAKIDQDDPDAPPVFPDVFFGGVRVDPQHVTFPVIGEASNGAVASSIIVVEETPPNPAGATDVTVINYDGATATLRNGFTYRLRQVDIDTILPNSGNVYGGDQISVTGRDFVERGLHVVFGNETGSTDIYSGFGNVQLGDVFLRYEAGQITFYYQQMNPDNEMTVQASTGETSTSFPLREDEVLFFTIPWSDVVEADDDKALWADEGIKVALQDNQVVMTRRLGKILSVEGENRIRLETPPASQLGAVDLTVYNSDGINASGEFTYTSPFRPPVITNIIPVISNYQPNTPGIPDTIDLATAAPAGGSPLIIQGSNFRAGVSVYIGDIQATIVNRSLNDDELIITAPPASAGTVGQYLRILVTNGDGGMTYGDLVPQDQSRNPYYFRYTTEGSNPTVTLVDPGEGPVTGGTRVIITGTDFRGEDAAGNPRDVQVFAGGFPVAQEDVTFVNDRILEVVMPAGRVGTQIIEVLNHDFGRAVVPDMFTYISQPNIATVDPARIFANDTEREVTVTGEMFQAGAQVILGGRLVLEGQEPAGETLQGAGIRGVDDDGENRRFSVVGGVAATNVTVTNEGRMLLQFPEALDLATDDLIIINPDGGLSDPFDDFDYAIPIPDKPLVLEAIPGAESSVHLVWSMSGPEVLNAADHYEVYGKRSIEGQYTFIGDTEEADFLVRGLEPDTRYDFMVRALNRYGSAIEFAEVEVRTFSLREDPKLREKVEELDRQQEELETRGKEEIVGTQVIRTVGSREIGSGSTPYIFDFSGAAYSRQNEFIVAFPVSSLAVTTRPVIITDGKATLTITPNQLLTRDVAALSAAESRDAVVLVHLTRLEGQTSAGLTSALTRTQRQASAPYKVKYSLRAGNGTQELPRLLGNAALTIGSDANTYGGVNDATLMKYDPSSHRFNPADSSSREPGTFQLIGNR